jgi:hypothetical protein
VFKRLLSFNITCLFVQPFYAWYIPCLLKTIDLDSALKHDGLGLLINVIKHLIINLQRFKQLLVQVLEGDAGQI